MPLIEHRVRELETKFQYLTGHKHTGAQGDAPIISAFGGDSDSITEGSVHLFATVTEKANWNSAYSLSHAAITLSSLTGFTLTGQQLSYTANYSLPLTADTGKGVTAYGWGDHSGAGYLVATTTDKSNWNTAYGWGDHASGGYAVLAGKLGGQTLVGDTATAGDLYLYANAANDGSGIIHLGYAGGIITTQGTVNFTGSAVNPVNIGTVALVDVTLGTYQGLNFSDNILHATNGLYVRTSSVKVFGSTSGKDVTIQALATTAADFTLTLPPNGGTADYLVKTDGAGVLSYVDPATLSVADAGTAGTANYANSAGDSSGWNGHSYPASAAGALTDDGVGNLSWVTYLTAVTTHNLLSTTHGDTLADTVIAGDLMIGNATPKWSRLAKGNDNDILSISAATHLPVWVAPSATLPGLADGKIWVGNAGGAATAVTPSGDVTMSNAGVTAIGATKITDAMINSGAVSILHPSGSIIMYGGSSAPTGWLLCDGASYLRADYAALYAIIGNAFGTADGTHFNVPDMKGAFPRGAGQSTIFTDNVTESIGRTASKTGGATSGVGSKQDDQFQGHFHDQDVRSPNTGGTGTNYIGWTGYNGTGTVTQGIGNPSTDGVNGTPRSASENRPKNIEFNFIIKT